MKVEIRRDSLPAVTGNGMSRRCSIWKVLSENQWSGVVGGKDLPRSTGYGRLQAPLHRQLGYGGGCF